MRGLQSRFGIGAIAIQAPSHRTRLTLRMLQSAWLRAKPRFAVKFHINLHIYFLEIIYYNKNNKL